MSDSKSIRLVIPQWQGGDNPAYSLGSKMLDWLAPETDMPVFLDLHRFCSGHVLMLGGPLFEGHW